MPEYTEYVENPCRITNRNSKHTHTHTYSPTDDGEAGEQSHAGPVHSHHIAPTVLASHPNTSAVYSQPPSCYRHVLCRKQTPTHNSSHLYLYSDNFKDTTQEQHQLSHTCYAPVKDVIDQQQCAGSPASDVVVISVLLSMTGGRGGERRQRSDGWLEEGQRALTWCSMKLTRA